MNAQNIAQGHRLVFKDERREAYGLSERSISVARIATRDGYKTPWIYDDQDRAFKPSDFSHRLKGDWQATHPWLA